MFWNDLYCIEDVDDDDYDGVKSFNIQLRASTEDLKEGDAVNLTCETPPVNIFHQQWLHPQKQARPSSVFCFCLSVSVLYLTNVNKTILSWTLQLKNSGVMQRRILALYFLELYM